MICRTITGRILGKAILLLKPASTASHPSAAKLLEFRSLTPDRPQERIILDFDKRWDDPGGRVHRWYMKQPSKRFTSLEYRKELNGMFKHEFIVVRLDNGTICRFDRRAKQEDRASAPTDKGAISEDTAHVLRPKESYYEETVKQSEVLLRIAFHEPEDLSLILAACCGIKANNRSKVYSLFTYNCYFFCWTLVSIAARRAAKWEKIASSEQEWQNKVVDTSLKEFSKLLGDTLSSSETEAPPIPLDKGLFTTEREPSNAPGRTPEEIAFRDALQESLLKIRHLAGEELRNLLLRSQLAPVLGKMVRKEVETALLEFKVTVAKDKGISVAMEQVSAARAHPNKPEKFGDLSWSHHCEIACTSAVEAASAAAEAAKKELESQTWEQEWNEKWEKHWNASMPAQGNTDETKRLEEVVRASAREAWRAEWDRAAATGTQYFSAIVETTTECLLNHLHDLPPDRLFLGKRAAQDNHQGRVRDFFIDGVKYHVTKHLGSNELSLQNYIRNRVQKHCETVDRYGFGSYDEVLQKVEYTMTEVWVATIGNWAAADMGGRTSA